MQLHANNDELEIMMLIGAGKKKVQTTDEELEQIRMKVAKKFNQKFKSSGL